MNFDGRSGALAGRPGKQRQAQVDDGGVPGEDGFLERHAELLVGVQGARLGDQDLGEVGVASPVALLVGVGQRVAGNLRATKTHVIEARLHGAPAGFDVAQAFAVGQLREGQGEELIQAGAALNLALTVVALHAAVKLLDREQSHDLREDGAAGVHAPSCHGRRSSFKSFSLQQPGKQQK